MKIKYAKNNLERSVAVFEILLMTLSILTFSYLIGEEIGLVDAFGGHILSQVPPILTAPASNPVLATQAGGVGYSSAQAASAAAFGGNPTAVVATPTTANPIVLNAATVGQRIWTATQGIIGNALLAYTLAKVTGLIGKLLGNAELGAELGRDIGWGYFAGETLATLLTAFGVQGWLVTPVWEMWIFSVSPLGLIGLGLGVLFFLFTYKDTRYYQVQFHCLGWQPISGGAKCEECNQGQFPCSEYRCESLGQGCEIVNGGTTEEKCVWNNRNDIAPPEISSWDEPLDENKFEYIPDTATLPGDKGVIIRYKDSADGCIPAYTVLKYGITLNKPGQCRMDTNRTSNYESMTYLVSSGYYLYNHTLQSVHAGEAELEAEGYELPNGGNYEVFLRCESKNGYSNDGTFVFKYCVDDEPDTTAPTIELTNPINNMPIQEGQTSVDIQVYTNKPSDCKWSHSDEDYDTMANTMSCSQSISEINANMFYKCTTTLTGLKDSVNNKFYFRCKSYPLNDEADRYENAQSYVYTLVGTKALVIDSIKPNATTIKDATENVQVTIDVKTSAGYDKGNSYCYLATGGSTTDYILFANTESYQHTQELWLTSGDYAYDIKCCDLGGNCDSDSIEFSVETDFEAPAVVRVYNDGNSLKLITNEKAECVYDTTSCSYEFENGVAISSSDNIEHTTDWDTENTFYIKCKDEFEGQPAADECTIIVRPSDTF